MLTHRKSRGIAIVAVLISAVVFLGIIIAITGTLSISSRQSTGDQRVSLEAQYAAESGLSRVIAEAQTGLLNNWSKLFFQVTTDTDATPATIEALARQFCNYEPADTILTTTTAGTYTFCAANPGTTTLGATQFDLFTNNLTEAAYTAAGVTPPVGADAATKLAAERAYWADAFSDGDKVNGGSNFRYEQSLSSGVKYLVSFGLQPLGVNLVTGRYRFEFGVRDSTSIGLFDSGSRTVSRRSSTRSYPDRYFIELEPPSFARYLSVTNRQVQASATGSGNPVPVYFTSNTLMDGPVFTNDRFNFRGNAWFSDSVRSAGCATTPVANQLCPGVTANYNDGDPSNPATLLQITATNASDASFPGYTVANAATNANAFSLGLGTPITSPEFVRDNFTDATRITYAKGLEPNPWAYTGEYNRPAIELPTIATDQRTRALAGGIILEPSVSAALGEYGQVLMPDPTSTQANPKPDIPVPTGIEMFATGTARASTTNYNAVDPLAQPATVYQFIRMQAMKRISRCRADATSVTITPPNPIIRVLQTQAYAGEAFGQTGYTFAKAPTQKNVVFSRAESPAQTSVEGTLSNDAAPGGLTSNFVSTSGVTNGSPLKIRATSIGGAAFKDADLTVRDVIPELAFTTNSSTVAYASNISRTFDWTVGGSGPLTITLTRTASNGGAPLTQTFTGTAATIATSFTDLVNPGTAGDQDTVYTYTITATNSAGETSTNPVSERQRTVTVSKAVAPSIELYTLPGENNRPFGTGTFRLFWKPYSGNVPTGPLTYTITSGTNAPSFSQDVSSINGVTTGISIPYNLTPTGDLDLRYNLRVTGPGSPLPLSTAPDAGGDWEPFKVAGIVKPVINSFKATPANLAYSGGVSTLSYNVTGINTTVTIDQTIGNVTMTNATTLTVPAPFTNLQKTYTINASNSAGNATSKTVTVTIDPPQPPTISSFTSDDADNAVFVDTPVKLNWTIASEVPLTSVTLQRIDPNSTATTESTVLNGSKSGVIIGQDSTYKLTVTSSAGTTTRNLRMLALLPPAPVLDFKADPNNFPSGSPAVKKTKLTYGVISPAKYTIGITRDVSYSGNTVLATTPLLPAAPSRVENDLKNVELTQSTWFTLTATNAGGVSTYRVLVVVGGGAPTLLPLPTLNFTGTTTLTPTPSNVVQLPVAGGTARLAWATTNNVTSWVMTRTPTTSPAVTSITGDSPGRNVSGITNTTSYTLTVTNATGSVSKTVVVNVALPPLPIINSYAINGGNPVAYPGGNANHTYSTTNADSWMIDGATVGASSAVINISTTPKEYTLTASNAAGSVQLKKIATIAAQVKPDVTEFKANPTSLPYGGGIGTNLSWKTDLTGTGLPAETTYALKLISGPSSVTMNGSTVVVDGQIAVAGPNSNLDATALTKSGSYKFRLTATNGVGSDFIEATVTVAASTLALTDPTASSTPIGYLGNTTTTSTLSWTATGTPTPVVTIARIAQPAGAPSFSSAITGAVGSSQSQVVTVGSSGDYTYAITATSPDTSRTPKFITKNVTVRVNPPENPNIGSFTASKESLNAPGSVGYVAGTTGKSTLTWGGITGSAPVTLSISPSIGAVTGDPGSRDVNQTAVGAVKYTITATGPSGTTPDTRDVTVTVKPLETLVSLGATGMTVPKPSTYMPKTGTVVFNPPWKVTPKFTTTNGGGNPVVTAAMYTRGVSPSGQAVSLPTVDADGNVGFTVGQLPTGIDQRDYTINVSVTVNGKTEAATPFVITVVREGSGSSLRPRARLTETTPTCTTGSAVEYLWPVFIEYHIEQSGGTKQAPVMTMYTRTYGAEGEMANPGTPNWTNRPATATPWVSLGTFNGTIYIGGQTTLSGPDRIGISGDTANPLRTPPAVAKFAGLTLVSTTGMTITSDLTYQTPVCTTPPVRKVTTGVVTPAICETDNTKWERNVLGLFSPTGDINIKTTMKNPTIHAIAMASSGAVQVDGVTPNPADVACPSTLILPANDLGSVNIQGGLIQNTYGMFGREQASGLSCGYGRTMTYDRRMRDATYNPPGFPTASNEVWTTRVFANGVQLAAATDTLPLRAGFSRIK